MKLAQFIQTEMKQLLEGWEAAALEVAPGLGEEESRALKDHARSMMAFISREPVSGQTEEESARKPPGIDNTPTLVGDTKEGTPHLKPGLSMLPMIRELQALRSRATRIWSFDQSGRIEKEINELVSFNEGVDHLVASLVSSFSAFKEQELRLFETMLRASVDPAAMFDLHGRLLYINSAMADLVGVTPRDAIGNTPFELGMDFAQEFHDELARTATTGLVQRGEFLCRLASGSELYFDSQLVPVFDESNEVEAVVKTSRDITERKQTDCQAWRNANFDTLTGIPNRRLFLYQLAQTVLAAERNGNPFALAFIDLDRFKQANDQLGHGGGDRLLALVAGRLSTSIRATDIVARLGGDEFTLLLKDTDRKGAQEAANTLLANLERAFDVDSHRVQISGSIGLTFYPDDGQDSDQLMRHADQAMYAAKKHGGQRVQVYEPWMSQSESEHMRWNRELDDALRENQLEVYYQPIIDLRKGTITRAEALLRWNHPEKGLLAPVAFLTITEQSGMTDRITAYVLEQAVISSLRWRDLNGESFPININESPASFLTRSLIDQWRARLADIGLHESLITMELTPASLSNISSSGFNPVKSLGLAGMRLHLALDDFGIEPFSLLALQEFKVDSIKIDRELIKNAGQGGDADSILEAIIAMAHAINVQVVAVGVEKIEQLHFLTRAGCDYAQGFLFSMPLTQDDFETLLRRDHKIKSS